MLVAKSMNNEQILLYVFFRHIVSILHGQKRLSAAGALVICRPHQKHPISDTWLMKDMDTVLIRAVGNRVAYFICLKANGTTIRHLSPCTSWFGFIVRYTRSWDHPRERDFYEFRVGSFVHVIGPIWALVLVFQFLRTRFGKTNQKHPQVFAYRIIQILTTWYFLSMRPSDSNRNPLVALLSSTLSSSESNRLG